MRGHTVELSDLSHRVIGCAIEVHRELGPGLLESIYRDCLAYELRANGISCETEREVPIFYKGHDLRRTLRVDLIAENQIIVEVKSVEVLKGVYRSKTLTYMKHAGMREGFLVNFNVTLLKHGLVSLVL
jgi:GxxExxY protein